MSQGGTLSSTGGGGGITFPITVPQGGTGQTSFPAHTVLLGEGTAPIGNVGPGAANTILMGAGAGSDPVFGTLVAGSNITLTNGAGTITISATSTTPNAITFTDDAGTTATTNAGAINLFGTAAQGISVLGNGASTITVSASTATTSQRGVIQLATNAQAIGGTDTSNAVTSASLAAKLGTQVIHGVLLGEGTNAALGVTAAGNTNTVLLGNTGADPSFGQVPNGALQNSSVTLNSGNNITVTGGGPLALGGTASFNVTGTTNHAVQVGNASGSLTSIAVGTNGQVLIGSTGADPIFGTITSPDNSILIGLGAGTLTLQGNTAKFGETITGNTGGPLSPTAGNWNILGNNTQGLTFNGAGSTLTGTISTATTTQLGVILLASNAQAIAGTDTANAITSDDLRAKLGVQTNNGVAFGQGTAGVIGWTAAGTTGQVLTANTGGAPTWGPVPPPALTITGDTGGALSPTANNWNILGQQAGTIPVMDTVGAVSTLSIEDRTWTTSFIVDPSSTVGLRGTFTTIQSAINAAVAPATIFIRDGQYTENLTLKSGVNLVAYESSQGEFIGAGSTANVKIIGKLSASFSGSCWVCGVCIQTNSDFAVSITGTNVTNTYFLNCNFNALNNTLINFTSSQDCRNYFLNCNADLETTGIAYISNASGGISDMRIIGGEWANDGLSTTPSTLATLSLTISNARFFNSITTSSSGKFQISNSFISGALITAGTGSNNITFSGISSGSASAISIGAGTFVNVENCTIGSSNTNAITGAGTIRYSNLIFDGTSNVMNVTTQTAFYTNLGKSKASGQPAFYVYLSASELSVVGNSSTPFKPLFDTKAFDQDSNYSTGSSTFTAPVAGRYYFNACVRLTALTAAMTNGDIRLVAGGITLLGSEANVGVARTVAGGTGEYGLTGSWFVNMNAGDTAIIQVLVEGGVSASAGILGGQTGGSYFQGWLVC